MPDRTPDRAPYADVVIALAPAQYTPVNMNFTIVKNREPSDLRIQELRFDLRQIVAKANPPLVWKLLLEDALAT